MKKLIALLLLATILTTTLLLAACGGETEVSSSAPSTEESVDESISEDTSSEEEIVRTPVRENPHATVVSLGKTYTNSERAGEQYPDSYGSELTDGRYAPDGSADYNDESYAGFHGNSSVFITVDLGEVFDSLYEFRLSYLSTHNAGLVIPRKVRVSVSEDGDKYTTVGDMEIPGFEEGRRMEAALKSEVYFTARYIRFAISKSGWLFLDELAVIADEEAKVNIGEGYPGWKPNMQSAIKDIAVEAYEELFNVTPQILAIHAGLECGLFLSKYPHLDMISFGPTLRSSGE